MPVWHFDFNYENDEDVFAWVTENIPEEHIVRRIADQITRYPSGVPFVQKYANRTFTWRHRFSFDNPESAAFFKLRWGGVIDNSG